MWTKRTPRFNELDDYLAQLSPIEADFMRLVEGLADAQMAWRPGPKRWSIAECLEHLNITAARFLPVVDPAMEKGRSEGLLSPGPFLHPWFGDWINRNLEPPPKIKAKAGNFAPETGKPLTGVAPRFATWQGEIRQRIHQATGLDLVRIKVTHPAIPFLRYTLGQTFAMLLAHERRHLWQAWQVRRNPQFPSPR